MTNSFVCRDVEELKKKLVLEDTPAVQQMLNIPSENCDTEVCVQYYVGGVDISFLKDDEVNACAALVVLSYPQLEVSGLPVDILNSWNFAEKSFNDMYF